MTTPEGCRGGPLTLSSFWFALSGRSLTDDVLAWPPDTAVLTTALLERSQAFRFAVSPPRDAVWPPELDGGWAESVGAAAEGWIAWVEQRRPEAPALVRSSWRTLAQHGDVLLDDLGAGSPWALCVAVLTLNAVADEACAGFAPRRARAAPAGCRYTGRGRELLARTGSLATLPVDRVRLLPKGRTPTAGITHRSVSRYVSVHHDGLRARWCKAPVRQPGTDPRRQRANVLLLPWPLAIPDTDFVPMPASVQRPDREPYGLFGYEPSDRLDLDLVDGLLAAASSDEGRVDVVILPESAVEEADIDGLERVLARHGTPLLVAGVRTTSSAGPPGNAVHLGVLFGGRWWHYRQPKHHRWYLDANQIEQYGLGSVLDPRVRWWEAMDVPRRSLQLLEVGEGVTLAGVACEDLARLDGVADLLRSVGPTLVIVLLLDGPQLASRWTARYATVLADDPGCAVLTLTALGMVRRSIPPGAAPSRAVAMWKDAATGLREFTLEPDAEALLVTLAVDRAARHVADGRHPVDDGAELRLADVRSISINGRGGEAGRDDGIHRADLRLDPTSLGVLVSWADTVAEALLWGRDTVQEVLTEARLGAVWRAGMQLDAPCPDLTEALTALERLTRAVLDMAPLASWSERLDCLGHVSAERDGLSRLVRRVLRTAIESVVAYDPA